MTIRINQTPVDFSLEQETTLAEVMASLQGWAQSQNLVVVGHLADGKALGASTPLTTIRELDVEVVPISQREASQAEVLAGYFELLSQAAENPAVVADLRSEYSGIRQAWATLIPATDRWSGPLAVLDGSWEAPQALASASAEAAQLARLREAELRDPHRALAQTLKDLQAGSAQLADLGLLFQRGQDREAFASILSFFTGLEDLGRQAGPALAAAATDLSRWEAFQAELQPFLKETHLALESQDYILLNDLLEYEVIPRLSSVAEQFPFLSNLDPPPGLL